MSNGDPFFSNVVALLDMSAGFPNDAPNGTTWTSAFSATSSATNSLFGNNLFVTSATAGHIQTLDNSAIELGGDDFALEFWLYIPTSTSTAYSVVVGKGLQGFSILWLSGRLTFYASSNGSAWDICSDLIIQSSPARDTWHHIAVTREGSTFRSFFNGVLQNTQTSALSIQNNTLQLTLMGQYNGAVALVGHMDEFRLTKGVPRYTANFTVPSEAFPRQGVLDPYWEAVSLYLSPGLTNVDTINEDRSPYNQSVTIVGNVAKDTNLSKIGLSSIVFDGSPASYLNATDNSLSLRPFFGVFTLEMFVRLDSDTGITQGLVFNGNPGSNDDRAQFEIRSDRTVGWYAQAGTGTGQSLVSSTVLSVGTWYHLAFVQDGTQRRLFIDGSLEASDTYSSSATLSSSLYVGIVRTGGAFDKILYGNIDDFKLTQGYALYDSAGYTVPIGFRIGRDDTVDPFFDNVSVLLPMDSDFTDKSNNEFTFTSVGGAITSALQSKYGGGSGLFDGSSAISAPSDAAFNLTTEDFTMEFWAYFPTGGSNVGIMQEKGGQTISIFYGGSNEVAFYASSTGSSWNISSDRRFITNPSKDTWHHIAVTRSGTTWRGFWNGVQAWTFESSASIFTNTDDFSVGGKPSLAASFDGNIDDFRLTKGVARYTNNFTVPSQAFPVPSTVDPALIAYLENFKTRVVLLF